jgi:NNP family nitrate/nitrite transporter-like MFS transporter
VNLREFRQAGHWPTLLCAFLYFDVSFMVWVLIGALSNAIFIQFPMSPMQKGLLVGLPILGGAVLRLVMGIMTDRFGGRRTGLVGMMLTMGALALGWLWASSFAELLIVAFLLGMAGASFAVALPLASRWYPPKFQGLALGIAGAGNSGTAIATLVGPMLAGVFGWHAVFGLCLIPLGAVFLAFLLFAKDSPNRIAPKQWSDYAAVLRIGDTWRLCIMYAVTFGGFVGLASFLNLLFHQRYGLSPIVSGILVTVCVVAGSFLRPVGGYLADRIGGLSLLTFLYAGIALLLIDLATSPPLAWGLIVLVLLMAQCGLGNGAVFQLVPQRFPREIGLVSGIVGAAGSLGGFLVPTLLGACEQLTGGFGGGFFLLSVFACCGLVQVMTLSRTWEGVFIGKGGLAAEARPLVRPEPTAA